jgi:hypothetical protein
VLPRASFAGRCRAPDLPALLQRSEVIFPTFSAHAHSGALLFDVLTRAMGIANSLADVALDTALSHLPDTGVPGPVPGGCARAHPGALIRA